MLSSIFLLCLMVNLGLSKVLSPDRSLQVSHLTHITREIFSLCDLYLTIDHDDGNERTSSTSKSLVDEIASLPTSTSHFVFKLDTYFQKNTSSCSTTFCFHVSTRKYSQCSLVLGIFFLGKSEISGFMQLLISPFQAPLKNEQDHFIFFVGSTDLDSFVRNPNLAVLKYKLGISISNNGQLTQGKTLCFFCNNGDAHAVSIELIGNNSMDDLFPDFTKNGNGHVMRVSAPLKYPFLYELAQVDEKWRSKRGVYKFVIDSLITHYNFTFTVFPSPGHGSGAPFKNGTWNGVMGHLLSGQADFGASTSPNPSRFPLTSFSTAMIYPFVSFTVGPPKITYSWKAIYWPFTPALWFSITSSLAIVILTFKIFQSVKREQDDFPFYRHLVMYTSFTLIGVGLPYPKVNAARIILTVWLFATLIFNTLYVSKIVGLLAFPLYEKEPRTFKSLVESGYSLGFDKAGGNMFAHFKTSSNPVFQKIIEMKQPEKDDIDCYNTAIKIRFACITWAGAANYIAYKNLTLSHGKSPLVFSEDITLSIPTGITFPRRTLHRLNFDNIIGFLRDSGQIDNWIMKDLEHLRREKVHWQQLMNVTVDDESGESGPNLLSLSNLLGVFYLYIIGLVIAIMVFSMEFLKFGLIIQKLRVQFSGNTIRID